MKRVVAILTILFASVMCTACLNNFAIQELNNKAREALDVGDVDTAICRLQSSVDLDANIFESRYNLAVALVKAGKYKKAKEQIQAAIELKDNIPEAYFTQGVVLEGVGANIIDNVDEDSAKSANSEEDLNLDVYEMTPEEIQEVVNSFSSANKSYQKYLELAPEASDRAQVEEKIRSLEDNIKIYTEKLNSPQATKVAKEN